MVSRLVTRIQPLLRRKLSAKAHTVRVPLPLLHRAVNARTIVVGRNRVHSPLPLLPPYASLKQKQSTHAVPKPLHNVKARYAFHLDIVSVFARLSSSRPHINLHSLGFNEGTTPDLCVQGRRAAAWPRLPLRVPPSSEARGYASLF